MSPRIALASIAAVLLAAPLLVSTAQAQSGQADCRNLPGDVSDDGWIDHEQLGNRLAQIEATSSGRVDVDVIGYSHRGREIYSARVGTGDRVLLVTSEIHGNEKTGTEALLALLKTLGSSNSPHTQAIREGVTIVAVPKFNPDGAEMNRRHNDFPWDDVVAAYPQLAGADRAWYYNANAQGFDLNRDFNADLTYEVRPEDLPGSSTEPGYFLANESRVLRDLYVDLRDEFGIVDGYVDLHHMGPCTQNPDGQYVTVALDYPPLGGETWDGIEDWPLLDQDKSRRFALAAALGLEEKAGNGAAEPSPFYGGVTQFVHRQTGGATQGQARTAFALNGTGTVLFEVRGQSHNWGQKQKGMLTQVVLAGLSGIVERMADSSIDDLDGDDFYDLPRYW